MAIGSEFCIEALNYYMKGFFKDIHSVVDMGDQDLNITYSNLVQYASQAGIKIDENIFERAKHFPERPRVHSSAFWKMLGVENAERIDISSLDRINPEDQKAVIIMDLNEPLLNKKLWNKYPRKCGLS